ncbi:ABC transporter ATP-binding protein [Alloyangia pacifica]|uniref:ABC transporter ATP-binding protein n=1 Tax=Alloyangia pacifica TaxID=311180 RepID=UPI001CFD6A4A|nr:ABC transporter ATP-binding protein [Alloyangia pacifica]
MNSQSSPTPRNFLDIDRVTAAYGETQVLHGVSLDVSEGEMHVLLGPSGCGKTTLLRAISGLQPISGGTMTLGGTRIDDKAPDKRGLAMVFQHYALFPNMSVRGNLAFGLRGKGLSRPQIDERVERMLHTVDLTARADARPAALSGGQRQRVALARALVVEPRLLLLDEPLSALDAQIRKRLQLELKRLQRAAGLTAILVTHDQDEAMRLGDRITLMDAGHIAQTSTPAEIHARPANRFVARFFGEANILPADWFVPGLGGHAVVHPTALMPAPDASATVFTADVIDTEHLGALRRVNCRASGEEIRFDFLPASTPLDITPGTRIAFGVRGDAIHYVDG